MPSPKRPIVTEYIRTWPREIFYMRDGHKPLAKGIDILKKPGVYILYQDDRPYYVGKAANHLYSRLSKHANTITGRYSNLWNFFSALVVDKRHIEEIEGILIAAMPTENSSVRRMKRAAIPRNMTKRLRAAREKPYSAARN